MSQKLRMQNPKRRECERADGSVDLEITIPITRNGEPALDIKLWVETRTLTDDGDEIVNIIINQTTEVVAVDRRPHPSHLVRSFPFDGDTDGTR